MQSSPSLNSAQPGIGTSEMTLEAPVPLTRTLTMDGYEEKRGGIGQKLSKFMKKLKKKLSNKLNIQN
jgi:hypothetical protein